MLMISKRWTTGWLGALLGLMSLIFVSACVDAGEHAHHDDRGQAEHHGHETAHGGELNVIEECAIGHVEVIVDGDMLKVWFVGGDGATTTAIRVTATEIPLLVTPDEGVTIQGLTLVAAPMVLAEETVGDCSHFAATAPWLAAAKRFTAVGLVKFKGVVRVLRIDHPEGFDPDHDGEDRHHED